MDKKKKIIIKTEVLFDGKNTKRDVLVIIENGKISFLEERTTFPKGEDINFIHTKFLMPSLIDSHVHIMGYKEGFPGGDPFKPMKYFLKLLLCNGVTTVRDVGNNLETVMYLKKWQEKYSAPQIFSSGPLLDTPPIIWPSTRVIFTEEDAKTEINRLCIEGVDLIKVYKNIPGHLLRVIINEAHNRGLKVAGDLEATSAYEAINMGIDTLEHVINLINETYLNDDEKNLLPENKMKRKIMVWSLIDMKSEKVKQLLENLAKSNTYICPTLMVLKRNYYIEEMFKEPNLDYMIPIMPYHRYFKYMQNPLGKLFGSGQFKKYYPISSFDKEEKKRRDEGFQKMFEFTKILQEFGIRIIVGTDTPNPSIVPGVSLHQELKLLIEAGISLLEALVSATSIPAKALGRDDIGVIKPGAFANLLLINGNPIENIEELGQIEGVILKGDLFKQEELAMRLNIQ